MTWVDENTVCELENVRAGRWWVMLTSTIQHKDLFHLGINMYCLWSIGPGIVSLLGAPAFASLWIISAGCGSAAELTWHERQDAIQAERQKSSIWGDEKEQEEGKRWFAPRLAPGEDRLRGSVGASSAMFGLLGALVCVASRTPIQLMMVPVPFSLWQVLGATTVGSLYCLDSGTLPSVGHAGHLGGLFGGLAAYYFVVKPWLPRGE